MNSCSDIHFKPACRFNNDNEMIKNIYYEDMIISFENCCYNKNFKIAKWIMKKNPKIDIDKCFNIACRTGFNDIVKWFIDTYKNLDSSNCLINACQSGNLDLVKFFNLSLGYADIDNMFKTACYYGKVNIVEHIYNIDNSIINRYSDILQKYFINAVLYNDEHLETIKFLVKNGAVIDKYINSLFEAACIYGHLKTVIWLYEMGADIHNCKLLNDLIVVGNADIIEWFYKIDEKFVLDNQNQNKHLDSKNSFTESVVSTQPLEFVFTIDSFIAACRTGDVELVKRYTSLNTDLNFKKNGRRFLYNACMSFNVDVCEYLTKIGVTVDADDYSLLLDVCEFSSLKIVKWLEKFISYDINKLFLKSCSNMYTTEITVYFYKLGADIHISNDLALINACNINNDNMINLLIDMGIDIHAQNDSAVAICVKNRNIDIVKKIVDVDTNKTVLREAFNLACYYNCPDIVKYLYTYLDDSVIDNNLFLKMCDTDYMEIAKFLYDNNKNVNINDAFRYACMFRHPEVAAWLYSIDKNVICEHFDVIDVNELVILETDEQILNMFIDIKNGTLL